MPAQEMKRLARREKIVITLKPYLRTTLKSEQSPTEVRLRRRILQYCLGNDNNGPFVRSEKPSD